MRKFVGRNKELETLKHLQKKKSASLVVIRGRRRIGKSRLAEEFGHAFKFKYTFSGLPPDSNITAEKERNEFERQLSRYKIPSLRSDDWGDLLWALAEYTQKGSTLIVLDEISWMASKDSSFLGKLKTIWDQSFSKNPHLIIIISGSHSTWIDKNILSHTGFVGRISYILDLKELPIKDCKNFWNNDLRYISSYEIFKTLAITGGIPRYLEEIQPSLSAEENIRRLCFDGGGLLFHEFEQIFSDLFSRRILIYKELLQKLIHGPLSATEVALNLKKYKSGDINTYLTDLTQTGFLSRDFTWAFRSGKLSKLSRYRISDNYVRFYLKYIEPNRPRIQNNEVSDLPQSWLSILGLQFENLVINNRSTLFKLLKIPTKEIIAANPYFQTETKKQDGCQIDFLIQTQYGVLYVCEIKFLSSQISTQVIQEVDKKIQRLKIPKGFSIRPILIHVNGVANGVIEERYFAEIIDFNEFLE